MFLYLYIYMYNCMFVSALPDPTCNSEKSANGGNKQILLLLLLLLFRITLTANGNLYLVKHCSRFSRFLFVTFTQKLIILCQGYQEKLF